MNPNMGHVNLKERARESKVSAEKNLMTRSPLRYEQLVRWATQEWQRRYPAQRYATVWAADECASALAQARIKPGRKLKRNTTYIGYQPIDCPYAVPISHFYVPERKAILTNSVGAFVFSFASTPGVFDVLFASAYHDDNTCDTDAIALVPVDKLEVWDDFEDLCRKRANNLERSQKVYIIGGTEQTFQPTVDWEQVILAETLKADLRNELENFFSKGVGIYQQLNLPPFRKLLLVGPPGTGKSTVCAALAKLALQRKCMVVYISAANKEGAAFQKISRALKVVADSRHPVLLIVEELDIYLHRKDKSLILNVLDGMETPKNLRGALLLATTNYPDIIDERIAKRPGRVDRIIHVPPIQDLEQAERMLIHYMGPQWQDEYRVVLGDLIGQTGAFVREVSVYARMLAANDQETAVSLDKLRQSIARLTTQLETGTDLVPRRQLGFVGAGVGRGFSTNTNTSDVS
jgi:hypothetical protein